MTIIIHPYPKFRHTLLLKGAPIYSLDYLPPPQQECTPYIITGDNYGFWFNAGGGAKYNITIAVMWISLHKQLCLRWIKDKHKHEFESYTQISTSKNGLMMKSTHLRDTYIYACI